MLVILTGSDLFDYSLLDLNGSFLKRVHVPKGLKNNVKRGGSVGVGLALEELHATLMELRLCMLTRRTNVCLP